MYFHKVHHPANFRFASRLDARTRSLRIGRESFPAAVDDLGASVFRVRCTHPRWTGHGSMAELATTFPEASAWTCRLGRKGDLSIADHDGRVWLETEPGRGFGVSGQAWLFQLHHDAAMQFYGMGEKTLGLELSRQRTKFWNADVWADFNFHRIVHESADPMYLSIPYLIVKQGNTYLGLLLNNPHAAFMATAPDFRIVPHLDRESQPIVDFYLGAPEGTPELYVLVGPSLDELTRKLQRLCGVTPRPPLWALGHHQCRWGYRNHDDLRRLDRTFTQRGIPTDGLWLDIDYMKGYRVFTIDPAHFKDPQRQLAALKRRVVPILDPGVKVDPAYAVYRDGLKHRAFCLNPAGTPFVGFVWPGATVFPDFSTKRGRAWWTKHTEAFARQGFAGAWVDMNDPSTGSSDPTEMRFDGGRLPHASFHNQYALGMAMATRAGFERARPGQRQFLLTRSGSLGIGRYAAVWTGDNFSNEHHLRQCIPLSLNLALSGVPFNGPDVPGFGGDATPALAVAWYKACFLFPFLRNHSAIHTRQQEPWAFGPRASPTIIRLIRLRYKLLPYLYNLFVAQERQGAAILRPLFHDFQDTAALPLGRIADQFLVGPAILQAPLVALAAKKRSVVLPAARWFDAATGRWQRGGRRIVAKAALDATPLFIRDGSIVPMFPGEPRTEEKNLHDIELHLFLSSTFQGEARIDYAADDGETLAYTRGEEANLAITAERRKGKLQVRITRVGASGKPVRVRFVVYGRGELTVNLGHGSGQIAMKAHRWRFAGTPLPCRISRPMVVPP